MASAAEGDTAGSCLDTVQPSDDLGPATVETAVDDFERALSRDRSHAVLAVGPGSRTANVLRALARRLAGPLQVVLLTDPAIGENEICAQILARWGQEQAGEAELRLMDLVSELASRESALVLLISDANCMPPRTLRRLGRLASDSRPGLRLGLVVASEDGREADAIADLVATLGVGAEKVTLGGARTGAESPGLARPPRTSPPASTEARGVPLPVRRPQANGVARPRRNGPRWGRWPLAASVALGFALAFLGVQQLVAPAASREVALELEPEPVEQLEPIRSPQLPLPEPEAAQVPVPEPEAARAPLPEPEAARAAPVSPSSEPPLRPVAANEPVVEPPAPATAVTSGPEQPLRPVAANEPVVEPPARTIAVSLNARPWARIEVDGREVGITPLGDLPMSPGPHRFRAYLADGRVIERVVRVDAYRDHIHFP